VQNGNETGVDCGGPDCAACHTGCSNNDLDLTIVLDNYPGETTWTITADGGGTVASGGPYAGANTTVVEDLCLVDGCYTFTIFDSYGDGICCGYGNGSYTLTQGEVVLAAGGNFGSSEATPFCLGGGPAPTCTDGVQNGNETGVDCGGSACPACPTCTDGVQNGNETGVDCGGPDCPSCPPPGDVTLLESYFETGWDGWTDGGSDCYRYNEGNTNRSYEGTYSIRIRDNSGTASAMTYSNVNLSGYSSVDVTFFFYANSMENGEDFWLRFYNGSSWQTVAAWARGTHFENGSFYTTTVTLSSANYNFASNSGFRFQCDASANGDQIYIDQVTAVASASSLVEGSGIVSTEEIKETLQPNVPIGHDVQTDVELGDLHVWPNPTEDFVTVKANKEIQSVQVVDMNGAIQKVVQGTSEKQEIQIGELAPGIYYLLIEVDGQLIPRKLVKI
ncbi:MAG: T9SS type A sorting domain-containing protein, partial [Saprospiraceae bacterium]|nr:T9SS type A sorting domain-containing protein [Saprospiraceae bacterium]